MTSEIIESTAVVVAETSAPNLFGSSEPLEIVARATAVANALKDVIDRKGLITNIQGKEYVQVGGWTLLGTMLGVFPVMDWCRRLDNGWEARVEARTLAGAVIGAAEAECTRDERMWSNRDDYALRSMAQTRATSKALRMPLGFVVTLAGYEATPAEEMTFAEQPAVARRDSGAKEAIRKAHELNARREPAIKPPPCPEHNVNRMKYIAAGISTKTGKPYDAFWTCEAKGCANGHNGKAYYLDADAWRSANLPKSEEKVDIDDLPNE